MCKSVFLTTSFIVIPFLDEKIKLITDSAGGCLQPTPDMHILNAHNRCTYRTLLVFFIV